VITPGSPIAVSTLPNLRDLGGWAAADGRTVRAGQLYRSTALDHLGGDDAATVAALGIRTVFDFRTEAERTAQPDRLPDGARGVAIDVMSGSPGAAPAKLIQLLSDPPAATEALGGGRAEQLFASGYREIISLPSALEGYRRFFAAIADDDDRPALFHCTTGKDRTGWAAASLLSLLGVPDDLVMREYLLTNEQLVPALQPIVDRFVAGGGDADVLSPVLGVRRAYLEASLDEMRTRFGSIEGYFAEGLGIDADGQAQLRATFLEQRPG
jgi:protein-tyrosine phosphatase